jgi:hypothetical protein
MEEENPATTEKQPEQVTTPPGDQSPIGENSNSQGERTADEMDGEKS